MKVTQWTLAGLVSALFFSGNIFAQTGAAKKPVPAKKPVTTSKPQPAAGSAIKLASNADSISYSIGMNIAQSLKQQGMNNVNTAALASALEATLKEKPTVLSPEMANQVLGLYMQKQYEQRAAESKKVSDVNKKEGEAFLTENKTKPGIVTTASGLQYQIVKEGTGAKPTPNDKVKVHYTGRLISGQVFDSSVERGQPAEFGVTQVIAGWTEALQLMPVGSKWKLFIPSALAYGDRGAGADIGPGATLIFDVELLDIVK